MIAYIMIILIGTYTTEPIIHTIEFNSGTQCYEVKAQLEKALEKSKPQITCVKK
jgi:hypothetical protein